MDLGNFSVSLAVKDIGKSKAFYEKLGFVVFGGDESQKWLIMKSPTATIGLFEGMFEKNTLTFNPGWDQDAKAVGEFKDVREFQQHMESQGLDIAMRADPDTKGPASLVVIDPDGNPILIDQHV